MAKHIGPDRFGAALNRHRRSRRAAAALLGLVLLLAGCTTGVRRTFSSGGASTGTTAAVEQVVDAAYKAGFRSESQLLAVTGVAIAESSLQANARHWQPEYGYRPRTDVIGQAGPRDVYSSEGRQLHSDRGVWQISSRWWPQFSDAESDDPYRAARAVYIISNGGRDFSPWDSYDRGTAQRHYDNAVDGWPALRPIVRDYLSS